jgi:hypothetical protein
MPSMDETNTFEETGNIEVGKFFYSCVHEHSISLGYVTLLSETVKQHPVTE